MYLTALQLPKAAFVSTTAVCLLVGQIPHLVSLESSRRKPQALEAWDIRC